MGLPDESRSAELVELAIQEGHDADIPSNEGVLRKISTKISPICTSPNSPTLTLEKDIEKDAGKEIPTRTPSRRSVDSNYEEQQNIVWWDGENDPLDPMNWPSFRKWSAIVVVSGITFLTPLGSSIFAPAVPLVMDDFKSNSELLSGFVVSVYVLGFAFGPLVIAPMSEMWGRLPLYHACNILFFIFTICCALSINLNMLVVFRFLAGSVGAAPLTLGGGTIADVMTREQRAWAMSVWVMGPTLGPVLGPIAGGFITESLGWRWNFWILSIASGVGTILSIIFMRESYAPAILERKAKRLRKSTGNPNLKSKLDSGLTAKDLFIFSIVRPSKMILFSPTVFFLSLYVAVTYSYLYLFFTTLTVVFETQYKFRHDLVGLSFLGIGAGQFLGQFLYSWFATRSYKKHAARGDVKPEQRLDSMMFGAVIIPVGLFWYGWTVEVKSQWMNPLVATAAFSMGLLFIFMPANTYLVDVYTVHAASAMAANCVMRSVVAAILPLAGPKMYAKLGYGWASSVLGFVALLLLPIPLVFKKYGERMRAYEARTLKL